MKIKDIAAHIEQFAPRENAAEWDNVGFLVGDDEQECTGVVVCLDCTLQVVREAVENGCNLIVAHHPFIFRPVRDLVLTKAQTRTVAELFRQGVNVYSAHTNLDTADSGIGTALVREFGGKNPVREGFGFYAEVPETTAGELARKVADALGDPTVKVCEKDNPVKRVYVISGSGGDEESLALAEKNADVLITGEVKHHVFTAAAQDGFAVIEYSHYYSEIICCDILFDIIKSRFGDLKVVKSSQQCPYLTLEEL